MLAQYLQEKIGYRFVEKEGTVKVVLLSGEPITVCSAAEVADIERAYGMEEGRRVIVIVVCTRCAEIGEKRLVDVEVPERQAVT